MSEDLQQEVERLRLEVASLRDQIGTIGLRLGPRQETQEDVDRRRDQLVKDLSHIMRSRL